MNGYRWVRVTRAETVPLREGRAVTLAGREIAIFNLGDRFLATDNRAPTRADRCAMASWPATLSSARCTPGRCGSTRRCRATRVQERLHHHLSDAHRGRIVWLGAAARDGDGHADRGARRVKKEAPAIANLAGTRCVRSGSNAPAGRDAARRRSASTAGAC
jgi:hypothetical protein